MAEVCGVQQQQQVSDRKTGEIAKVWRSEVLYEYEGKAQRQINAVQKRMLVQRRPGVESLDRLQWMEGFEARDAVLSAPCIILCMGTLAYY